MSRFLVCMILAAALVSAQPADPLLHKPAPQLVRNDINGRRVDLSAYRGKVVLLTFWATWCAPCQVEMPHFVDWQARYAPDGLQIVGVSMDDDTEPVLALTRKRHINYPIVMGDAQIGTAYGGILGLPVTFLIDREGKIVAHYKGEANLNAMERDLHRLLLRHGTQ